MKVFFLLSSTVAGLRFIDNVDEYKSTNVDQYKSNFVADSDSTPAEARRVPNLKEHFSNIIGNIPALDDL
jgi:hypothetical protein